MYKLYKARLSDYDPVLSMLPTIVQQVFGF